MPETRKASSPNNLTDAEPTGEITALPFRSKRENNCYEDLIDEFRVARHGRCSDAAEIKNAATDEAAAN